MPSYHVGLPILDVIFENNVANDALTGGAVLNTCVSLSRVGADSYFVSAFCKDAVSKIFKEFFAKNKINEKYMSQSELKSMVALAFKSASTVYEFRGDIPYQDMVAKLPKLTDHDIVQFGDYFVFDKDYQIQHIVNQAERATKYLDPNIRGKPDLNQLNKIINGSDIMRLSDEDAEAMYPGMKPVDILKKHAHLTCIYLTTSSTASFITKTRHITIDCPKISPVSTIGAGDNFNAGVIYGMLKNKLSKTNIIQTSDDIIKEVLTYGVKFAQNVCMSKENYVDMDFKP